MRKVFIAGSGMTPFRRNKNASLRGMVKEAVLEALSDSNASVSDVEMTFFGNAAGGLLTGQECIRGQVALRGLGLSGIPIINIENACASASSAFHLACLAVSSGQCDAALAVGAEKMSNDDRQVPLKALEAAADLTELEEFKKRIGVPPDADAGSVFMDLYAHLAKEYAKKSGATEEDFARVVVKSRALGSRNKKAQFRDEVTIEEVLGARSIAPPLTLMMCSPIGDGAAALVVASERFMRKKSLPKVEVAASMVRSGQGDTEDSEPVAQRAAKAAYEQAGIGPEDVDVVELHDAAAPAELMLPEQLGLAEPDGGGLDLLRSGATRIGGALPINPSGGLISKGHPIGATGCAQLVELADQLRGRSGSRQVEGARVALAENGGGWIGNDAAAAVVTVLVA